MLACWNRIKSVLLALEEASAFHAMKLDNAFLYVGQMSNLITKLSAHDGSPLLHA